MEEDGLRFSDEGFSSTSGCSGWPKIMMLENWKMRSSSSRTSASVGRVLLEIMCETSRLRAVRTAGGSETDVCSFTMNLSCVLAARVGEGFLTARTAVAAVLLSSPELCTFFLDFAGCEGNGVNAMLDSGLAAVFESCLNWHD